MLCLKNVLCSLIAVVAVDGFAYCKPINCLSQFVIMVQTPIKKYLNPPTTRAQKRLIYK